jgi:hypothetical protein
MSVTLPGPSMMRLHGPTTGSEFITAHEIAPDAGVTEM